MSISDSNTTSNADSDSDSERSKCKKVSGKRRGDRPLNLSPELAAIVGAEKMSKYAVVKKIHNVIKERNLYDPVNKLFAICDEEFIRVMKVERFRIFGIMKYLKNHFVH